ncbi:MAG: hypothetical protein WC823_03855 [Parcubacteria group bacterium]|jgi:hypothetical protein
MNGYEERIKQDVLELRNALIAGNLNLYISKRGCLMGDVATALMEQSEDAMIFLRGHLADFIPLTKDAGDERYWYAAWELLNAFCNTCRPLEQLRLASPNTISGKVLRLIDATPGVSNRRLASLLKSNVQQIRKIVSDLKKQCLITYIPINRGSFMLEAGHEILKKFK